MKTKSPIARLFRGALVAALLVGATAMSSDLGHSELKVDENVPHPEEVRLMEELAAWTGRTPTSSPAQPFPHAEDLTTSVQQYSESFDLFRRTAGERGRTEILSTLPYGEHMGRVAARFGLDPLLIAAIVATESSYRPGVVSPVGAQGLMQIMPETAVHLGAAPEEDLLAPNPMRNLELGARYLRQLDRLYAGDLALVLAAYNAGPGNVRKFDGIPPFTETRNYVEKVLGRYVELQHAALEAETYRVAELAAEIAAGS